jgi:hypothetical protein
VGCRLPHKAECSALIGIGSAESTALGYLQVPLVRGPFRGPARDECYYADRVGGFEWQKQSQSSRVHWAWFSMPHVALSTFRAVRFPVALNVAVKTWFKNLMICCHNALGVLGMREGALGLVGCPVTRTSDHINARNNLRPFTTAKPWAPYAIALSEVTIDDATPSLENCN